MSLVARYKFNDEATFTNDATGNSYTLTATNGNLSFNDATYGTVAYFSNLTNNYFSIDTPPSTITGNSSRSFSNWMFVDDGGGIKIIHGQGLTGTSSATQYFVALDNGALAIVRNSFTKIRTGTPTYPGPGQWFHLVTTYDGVTERKYIDGVLVNSRNIVLDTQSDGFAIGQSTVYTQSNFGFDGKILDFRIYNDALSASSITDLYNEGPNPAEFSVTTGVTTVTSTIVEVAGATSYNLTIGEDGSGTTRMAHTGTSTGDVVIRSLNPETSYTVQLFADTGNGNELVGTATVTTLANSAANYNRDTYGSEGSYDLSTLSTAEFALIRDVMNDIFTTGDDIEIDTPQIGARVRFVKIGESISTDDSILVPFNTSGGGGQNISMQLSDNTTVQVSYDETTEDITIEGTTYSAGDYIVIDGKKMTIQEL